MVESKAPALVEAYCWCRLDVILTYASKSRLSTILIGLVTPWYLLSGSSLGKKSRFGGSPVLVPPCCDFGSSLEILPWSLSDGERVA